MTQVATESGHWYDASGQPCYTLKAKDGSERNTTLRDARKLKLYPSVTTILSVAAKPQLEKWKQTQILQAALTLPKLDGETLDDYAKRCLEDGYAQSKAAREKGSWLHGQIERAYLGQSIESSAQASVEAVNKALAGYGQKWEAERSFSHPLGFGGKCDVHSIADCIVADFKTKEALTDRMAWPEQAMQLAAYREGFNLPKARCLNLFVDFNGNVAVHEWAESELQTAWEKFQCLLKYWQLDKGYSPCGQPSSLAW